MAYGSTPAVVDTVNKTITWTIDSFPGNTTNQTVTFELKTNDSYTGDKNVSFNVSARTISGPTVTPDQTVTQTYLYDAGLAPTPTPTAAPAPQNANMASAITPTVAEASPTPAPAPFAFSNVYVYTVSQLKAQISIATNRNATSTVQYGTSPTALSQNVSNPTPLEQAIITLPNLNPDTAYYFRTTVTDSYGNSLKSDIFTFRTAVVSEVVLINPQSLIVISNSNFLVNPEAQKTDGQPQKNAIVVPSSTNLKFNFHFPNKFRLKVFRRSSEIKMF